MRYPPLGYSLEKVLRDRGGGVSRTGPLSLFLEDIGAPASIEKVSPLIGTQVALKGQEQNRTNKNLNLEPPKRGHTKRVP